MSNTSFVYMLTNEKKNAFYVDITNDLKRRMSLHKDKPKGMVKDRKVDLLVYLDEVADMPAAIKRQKELKNMTKEEKTELVNQANPKWNGMNEEYLEDL